MPELAGLMDQAEADVPDCMSPPPGHRVQLHNTKPPERLSGEIRRRTEVVGIFANEAALARLVSTIQLEQNDE